MDGYLGFEDFGRMDYYYKRSQESGGKADSVVSKVWETVKTSNKDHERPQVYTGIYKDNWFGKIEIFINNGQLWFKSYRSPKLNGPMYYVRIQHSNA